MRIIGGLHRGTHLVGVGEGDASAHLRPTSDRVREAIFNLLLNGRLDGGPNPVADAHVLDLFAGTGAMGLEALSRGAAHASFVENGKAALSLLTRNIALLRREANCTTLRRDATTLGPNPDPACSLIFLDPPYGKAMGDTALTAALASNWIAPNAVVVWEESRPTTPPPGFTLIDQRKYGDTHITILRGPA